MEDRLNAPDGFVKGWVSSLFDSASLMPVEESARLLARCGERCARTGILETYRALFLDAGSDPDSFFSRLREISGVSGAVIQPGSVYEMVFSGCLCDLYTQGYTDSELLCECSRGSIAFVLRELLPARRFSVRKLHTVLEGAPECRFRIEAEPAE